MIEKDAINDQVVVEDITPDSIATPEMRRDMIALYGGEDSGGGSNSGDDILDPNGNILDPDRFNTNYGNGMREGPDLSRMPWPGGRNS